MSPTGRALRLMGVIVVVAALVAGTFWGADDHFPVGPFRMYSVTNKVDGEIATVTFSATTSRGERLALRPESFGLRPAEVEGQLDRLLSDPRGLGGLIQAYERLHEGAEAIAELRLVEEAHRLEEGRPVSTERRVLAQWERPP